MDGKNKKMVWFHVLLLIITISLQLKLCSSKDTISPGEILTKNQTIVSERGAFELGYFTPGASNNWYFGIWYKKIPKKTYVWVANRENPLRSGRTGSLRMGVDGNLVLLDELGRSLWSTNTAGAMNTSVAVLLDSGNLVLRQNGSNNGSENVLWQSFDHPTDTMLPGAKVGLNRKTSLNQLLTPWKNAENPAPGTFAFGLDPNGSEQFFVWQNGVPYWRSGPWNGEGFSGAPEVKENNMYKFSFVDNDDEVYFTYDLSDESIVARFVIDTTGLLKHYRWIETKQDWNLSFSLPKNKCEVYCICGVYGTCSEDGSPICSCLQGFEPKLPEQWELGDWSGGCMRKTELTCGENEEGEKDGFLRMKGMKLPDVFFSQPLLSNQSTENCEAACLNNCLCSAYAFSDRKGCWIWVGELLDLRNVFDDGQDLFIRLAASEFHAIGNRTKGRLSHTLLSIIVVMAALILLTFACFAWMWRRAQKSVKMEPIEEFLALDLGHSGSTATLQNANEHGVDGKEGACLELPSFNLGSLLIATKNFCETSKLGEGGFGPVYKGRLPDGQEIAVKRLARSSGQGLEEFKNEVILIAKLQHRNLVRLLGCCIQGDEKILVYEYMPNKSLDSFLFDPTKRTQLDWGKRFDIIIGVARGLLYLHQDSRLRIIHRDLKASNILLDGEMNAKISDFGMARIFSINQAQANTNRVVGTYGYMAPEYAMHGLFSVKSDVYSFGVLLLEIVSGRKNNVFYDAEHTLNLLGYTWQLWQEGKVLELMDPSLSESCQRSEVLRCMHVALLCVQEDATARPNMCSVSFMLVNETATLPAPTQPAFPYGMSTTKSENLGSESFSLNNVTMTIFMAR
ncbi:G-type lectin S-receptor-like serine/threonine-protein kinase At4g27290 [Amborella trichopoda]|nr:G-type lectin S-receptor-like serine/threonine-protein kinase At4g27290 [Amborella trichopoda]|eukprot:XP_006851221.2 G-type lectin S-receptor-like serine/threonine-protein kinase At4g27290 [Amborella trichopoda]